MIKKNQAELVEQLRAKEGYRFYQFKFETTSNCEVSDSDWNYKDIPHLKEVHHLVEGYPAYAGNDFISALLVQKVFGLKFPAVLFNYQSGPGRQTYFITLMNYFLIVETTYESLGKNRTRTTTNYAVGCKSWIGSLLFPICKIAIKRNFDNLMSGDLPMRERRGQLRDWGYTFKGDNRPYSFFETSLIMQNNVIFPMGDQEEKKFELNLDDLKSQSSISLGRADQFGLTVSYVQDEVKFFPRMCPHEGADLTKTCDGKKARCEWHGRKFLPLFTVDVNELKAGFNRQFGERFRLRVPTVGRFEVTVKAMN